MSALVFKNAADENGLAWLPKPLKDLLVDLAIWSIRNGLPSPVVTCLGRQPDANASVGGVANSLHLTDNDNPAGRAADLRDTQYSKAQMDLVVAWLRQRVATSEASGEGKWELIYAPHGTGPHIHIGLKRATT